MLNWIGIAAINMAIAVALGAFGAHGLEGVVHAHNSLNGGILRRCICSYMRWAY